jgi:hypothetical protein
MVSHTTISLENAEQGDQAHMACTAQWNPFLESFLLDVKYPIMFYHVC